MQFFIINDHEGFFKKNFLINCNVSEFTPSSGYNDCVHALVYTKFSVYKCMYTVIVT